VATQFVSLDGANATALLLQTALAGCKLRLFKSSFTPTPSSTFAEYQAAQADYDTYGQITIAAWNVPILAPGSGYMMLSPLDQFAVGANNPATPNLIGGCYVIDAANVVRQTIIFTSPVPMQLAGQGIPITITIPFPTEVTF
jgi:hypothetical protein